MVSDCIEKTRPSICYLQEIHFRTKDMPRLKVRMWKKIFHANIYDKKTSIAILISDKIYFRTKAVTKDKERYYIKIKGSKQRRMLHLLTYMYQNTGVCNYKKQILTDIRGDSDNNSRGI